jgi:hypothetical protein
VEEEVEGWREGEDGEGVEEGEMLWAVGDMSDVDDDGDEDEHHSSANQNKRASGGTSGTGLGPGLAGLGRGEEGAGLMSVRHEVPNVDHGRRSTSSDALVSADPFRDDPEEFGGWEGGPDRVKGSP